MQHMKSKHGNQCIQSFSGCTVLFQVESLPVWISLFCFLACSKGRQETMEVSIFASIVAAMCCCRVCLCAVILGLSVAGRVWIFAVHPLVFAKICLGCPQWRFWAFASLCWWTWWRLWEEPVEGQRLHPATSSAILGWRTEAWSRFGSAGCGPISSACRQTSGYVLYKNKIETLSNSFRLKENRCRSEIL